MSRLAALAAVAAVALAAPETALAHGIGGIRDLPVPGWLFLFGGAVVLIVSFVALGVLWTRPRLDADAGAHPLPPFLQRVLLAPVLRVALGAVSLALFVLVWLAAAFGDPEPAYNLAPTFVYVVFWLGLLPVVVLFGNVWSALSPWKAAADAVAWLARRTGRAPAAQVPYPDRLGRWPAVGLLFAFAALELAFYDPANPRVLAFAILVYSVVTWIGMAIYGRDAWLENGDGFSVYFGLLSRIAPFAVRDREHGPEVVVRPPLSGLTPPEHRPGTVAFVAVMLGSVAFDGFSRTTWWQDWHYRLELNLFGSDPLVVDLAGFAFNLVGLLAAIGAVALAYLLAVTSAQTLVGRGVSLPGVFVGSLVPIALVYAVAHYFSLFVVQGQFAIPLFSDPFGTGWDLLGTSGFQPKLDVLSPNMTWYVQVTALVIGHVFGLVVAHDRAVALVSSPAAAARTQYAMLALMVLYTVGGMWLLSVG